MADQWYYALHNEQKGPCTSAEMLALEAAGLVVPSTLVWKQGMPQWEPWESVADGVRSSAQAVTASGEPLAVCAYSQEVLPVSEMVRYGDRWVAAQHKDLFLQSLREGGGLTSQSGPGGAEPVGFWWRVLGATIDWGIKLIPSMAVFVPYYFLFFQQIISGQSAAPSANPMDTFNAMTGMMIGAYVLGVLGQIGISIFYETWMVGKYGATVGKMALGLRVLRVDGGRVTYWRALGRWAAKMLNMIIWFVPMYGLMAVGFAFMLPALNQGGDSSASWVFAVPMILAVLWMFGGGIGYYMVGWTKEKKGLHDIISATRVVRPPAGALR